VQTTTATSATTPRVLRRYANRKIYDPYQSRYVNHADIAELVRSGSDVRVLDSRTERDVTGLALAPSTLLSVRGQLERLARRLDQVHDQLRDAEEP